MHKDSEDKQLEHLEQLLKSLPTVTDLQDPDDLFNRITSRMAEEDKSVENKKGISHKANKKNSYIVPVFASIAAVLIFALIAPSMFNQDEADFSGSSENKTESTAMEKAPIVKRADMNQRMGLTGNNSSATNFAENKFASDVVASHVIQELPEGTEVVTVAIPDPNAQFLIPVSFVTPKNEAGGIAKLNNIATSLQEENWGLSPYLLKDVVFKEKNETTAIVDVPSDHHFNQGSTMETFFINSLKVMLKPLGYDEVELQTEGITGIELGNYGTLESLSIDDYTVTGYYLFEQEGNLSKFLVPVQIDVKDIQDAFSQMKEKMENLQVTPAIPADIQINSVEEQKNSPRLVVNFAPNTTLLNNEVNLLMIEAMLMTAKAFGFEEVQFNNTGMEQVGPYSLQEPIKVPIAANPMPYME